MDHSSGVIVPLLIESEGLNKHLVNLLFREGLAGGGQFAALAQAHIPKQEADTCAGNSRGRFALCRALSCVHSVLLKHYFQAVL